MGTTLENGVYLPSEGERNCYNGLASNWTTLDAVVGGYRAHVANENIHITSAERNKWDNGVTQAYVLRYANTSLTALGTVAFSALDNTDNIKIGDKVLDSEGKLFALTAVDTANNTATLSALLIDLSKDSDLSNYYTKGETDTLLSSKADDSGVMHLSGDEDVNGTKTFKDLIPIDGDYLGNESSTNERTNLYLTSNRDTADKSGAYISRFRPNKKQGELSSRDGSFISISFLENENRYTRCFDFGLTDWDADGVPQTYYLTSPTSKGALGTRSRKWQTINGIEPSSLSLPSGNTSDRIDISSYITAFDGTSNSYTPPANGWISISANNSTEVYVFLNNLYGVSESRPTAGAIRVTLPVLKGIVVAIRVTGGTIGFARFIPCQGNV